jgi:YVTN family beta-propeller protein
MLSDIRGFSTYAAIQGVEATAALAGRFQEIASKVIRDHDGEIVDRRGDEVLAAFESARAAIRAAVAFERQLLEATRNDSSLPLPAGVGLDFGEAIIGADGWSANAINIAARLCSIAAGGEILATEQLIHVAQAIDGLTYVERAPVSVKGIARPVRHVRVAADDLDTRQGFIDAGFPRAAPQPMQRATDRRSVAIGLALAVTLVAATLVAVVRGGGNSTNSAPIDANAVGSIATGSGRLTRQIDLGGAPGAVAADADEVWVVNPAQNNVSEIDPTNSNTSAMTITVGREPTGITIGYGATWVTNAADRSVWRINGGATPAVGDRIAVGNDPTAIAAGFGKLWVANTIDDTLSVIDPNPDPSGSSDQVTRTIRVGSQPAAVTTGFGSVWVANSSTATVSRVDPATGVVTATIGVGNGPDAIAASDDSVWVANALDDTVSRVDPQTNAIRATIHVGDGPTSVTPAGDDVWVTNSRSGSVSRISGSTGNVQRTIHVSSSPQGSAVSGTGLWVSARPSAAVHRGGTMRIVEDQNANSFDPAVAYTTFASSVLAITNDGLVTYQRTSGPGGATIVPDLATGLPEQANNGRTYTFQLRHGLHYSSGAPVLASDFRRSMERAFRIAKMPPYYNAILGAAACSRAPAHCNLSRGIITDDASGVITIQLAQPDPDLIYKLALSWAVLLPANTPARDLGLRQHASTGPYMISNATRSTVTLSRNPQFVQWSAAAQPAGYPDKIVIAINHSKSATAADADVQSVASGRYDWTPDQPGPSDLAELVRTRTEQVHPYAVNLIRYFFLNTAEPPFNDVRVRRAVNLAINRHAAVAALGGSLIATPTCQLIAPSMSGYQPYCPYTVHAGGSSQWSGPDLTAARSLVRQAGAIGAHVTVIRYSLYPAAATLLAQTLRAIGLRAGIRDLPPTTDYYTYILTAAHHVQAALEGWVVDYPEPSNLLTVILRCADRSSLPAQNIDESEFCDPAVDRAMTRALSLQVSDPAAAGAAWARIDREIDDLAPWVPLTNGRNYAVVSSRVGNIESHPVYGLLIDQAWVQ